MQGYPIRIFTPQQLFLQNLPKIITALKLKNVKPKGTPKRRWVWARFLEGFCLLFKR
jgi:hypothetical protein